MPNSVLTRAARGIAYARGARAALRCLRLHADSVAHADPSRGKATVLCVVRTVGRRRRRLCKWPDTPRTERPENVCEALYKYCRIDYNDHRGSVRQASAKRTL